MWFGADWNALLEGAIAIQAPARLWLGGAGLALLAALAIWRGPLRISVPATSPTSRRLGAGLDPAWLLSLTLRLAAIGFVVVALAGPVGLLPGNPAGGRGVDLIIALDASGSMNALDGSIDGRRVTRLDLARRVVAEFVRNRSGDRIGLVTFGRSAFTQCPLTVDHRLLLAALDRVEVGVAGDATALGEAIGLASRRLNVPGSPSGTRRILILLTDGRHNSGRLAPETAAEIAAMEGVRIHAVGIGGPGLVPFARRTPGEPLRFEEVDLDRDTLRGVAARTGGLFFHARRPQDLEQVAAAIASLEAAPHREEPVRAPVDLAGLSLTAGFLLLCLEALTAHGLLRRLP